MVANSLLLLQNSFDIAFETTDNAANFTIT
jgi:hypothetical protein